MFTSYITTFFGIIFVLFVLFFIILHIKMKRMRKYRKIEENENSVVIITGCDSGIGRTTTLFLIEKGFHVISSVLTEQGKEELEEEANNLIKVKGKGELSVKIVDITKDESVAEFREFVNNILDKSGDKKEIKVLVNNAGIALCGPLEVQPLSQFIRQIEVNLFGHVRVYQQFVPFIRKSSGRVINICSLAGRVTAETMSAYCASKYGMEAVTETTRLELRPWNVSVSAIEPGFMRTPMVASQSQLFEKTWDSFPSNAREIYSELYNRTKILGDRAWRYAADPINVTHSIYHAISSNSPKTRYLVGVDAHIIGPLRAVLPDVYFEALADLFFQ